ncbi:MAG: DUF5752 family protein [bacterium]
MEIKPFIFCTRLHLTELTGLKASGLEQLLAQLKQVPDSCIYHHTHRFLQQHQYLSPEPPNDFAYWVSDILGDDELGEELASIDTIQFSSLGSLRDKIISTIEKHIEKEPPSKNRFARFGEEFHFMKSISFLIPTGQVVNDLKEFTEILKKMSLDSIYFHIFESRLRLGRKANDFSAWIESSFGEKELARKISALDPYTYTLDELRNKVVRLIEGRSK